MNPIRCAVYARYSTDKQSPLSIEDQVRKCREYAMQRGWEFLEEWTYADEEISGATLERPGLREMLRVAESGDRPFDVVLAEDTSRLSRKLADVLNLCERLRFAGMRVCFVSQGIDSGDEQFQLLIAARGMIDQLFLTDTAKRVRRGMEGRVLKGFSFGGRCFGYRSRKEEGGPRLSVVEGEAAVVRRIFALYAQGWSLKKIAKLLNAEGVSSPRPQRGRLQRSWAPGAIRHILLNQRYTGKLVWNRQEKVRNPATGRRVKRARPESEWVRVEAPELRVVSDELWQRVQERFEFVRARFGTKSHKGLLAHWNAVGSRYLFSGILRCGVCGANMNIVSGAGKRGYSKYGCPMYHFRGSCSNGLTERSDLLEEKLLKSLQDAVLQQEVVDYTLQRFEEELRAKLESLSVELESVRRRKRVLEAEVARLTEGLATAEEDRAPAAVIAAIHKREQELRAITDKLVEAQPGSLDAKLKDIRRFVVSRLADVRGLLNSDIPTAKAELLRHVERIDLLPAEKNGKRYFEAVGEWNLLGGYPSTKSVGAGGRSCSMRPTIELEMAIAA